jgi:hypothetical protein
MRRSRAHRRSEARLLAELETVLQPGRRATIFGYAWWWRYELAIALGLGLVIFLLAQVMGAIWAVVGVSAAVGCCALWPPVQRPMATAAWRIVTPHRLRVGFVQARIQSMNGRLPTIVRTTSQTFGERVLVWCPAGTSVADFRSARTVLAAACWATDIQVIAHERHSQLATLDVIRSRWSQDEPVASGPELQEPVSSGPDWPGPDWPGPDWPGPVPSRPQWPGPIPSRPLPPTEPGALNGHDDSANPLHR